MKELDVAIRGLTAPLNGQYPRPWMTAITDPQRARIFVVGYNQATGWPETVVGDHDRYLDVLFNRNGMSCNETYDICRCGKGPSPTRRNIVELRELLARHGILDVIETNVVCYSTGVSADLTELRHPEGKRRGRDIFCRILEIIRPKVVIVHGSRAGRALGRVLSVTVPEPPNSAIDGLRYQRVATQLRQRPYEATIFAIPSLAPPASTKWKSWRSSHLDDLCQQVAVICR